MMASALWGGDARLTIVRTTQHGNDVGQRWRNRGAESLQVERKYGPIPSGGLVSLPMIGHKREEMQRGDSDRNADSSSSTQQQCKQAAISCDERMLIPLQRLQSLALGYRITTEARSFELIETTCGPSSIVNQTRGETCSTTVNQRGKISL